MYPLVPARLDGFRVPVERPYQLPAPKYTPYNSLRKRGHENRAKFLCLSAH